MYTDTGACVYCKPITNQSIFIMNLERGHIYRKKIVCLPTLD